MTTFGFSWKEPASMVFMSSGSRTLSPALKASVASKISGRNTSMIWNLSPRTFNASPIASIASMGETPSLMIFSAAVTAASSSKSRMAFFNSSMQATFAIEVTSRSVDTEKGFCSSFALESFRRAHPHYRAWLPGQPPDLNAAIHSDSAYRPLPPAIEYFSFNQT